MSMNALIVALKKEVETGPWRTADELAFLKRIGTHWRTEQTDDSLPSIPELDRRCKLTRIDMLKRYQESMQNRACWRGMDQIKICQYLKSALEVENL